MFKSFFANFNGENGCFNTSGGCGWKEIGFIFDDILKVLFVIGLFVGACMVSYAGWLLLSQQGSSAARGKAKNIFKQVVLGCVLLFGAYFVVDLILSKVGFTDRGGFVEPSQ